MPVLKCGSKNAKCQRVLNINPVYTAWWTEMKPPLSDTVSISITCWIFIHVNKYNSISRKTSVLIAMFDESDCFEFVASSNDRKECQATEVIIWSQSLLYVCAQLGNMCSFYNWFLTFQIILNNIHWRTIIRWRKLTTHTFAEKMPSSSRCSATTTKRRFCFSCTGVIET